MTDGADLDNHSPYCPFVVDRVAMPQRWDRLTFLHWKYPVAAVQQLLPPGLVVESYDGWAWVGLVPFYMEVRLPRLGRIPWLFDFPETNVRTYVRGPSGDPGVWFFSLEAARLAAVVTARSTYRVPYFWSQMEVARDGQTMRYTSQRRWPHPGTVGSKVEIEIGDPYLPHELTDFDHYLTARWTLYGTWGWKLLMARAQHAPWPLHQARVVVLEDGLVGAAGLPAPTHPPVVHWSPGVDVKVGYPWVAT
ncbi:MAG TPA: DUF2071 domain-containing protein [Acidimicrobiia bacterium]|nr:DUF2071 domain-containing protein [Acidimicrobiia bacterium]